ncbi:IS3 family insertion sequence transposase domain-containing protein (plasmid) [Rhizobium sp. NXC24]|nr:IS3 family insertion sequence transposase domain-containing protein [Rhizobium sp. NXC24]
MPRLGDLDPACLWGAELRSFKLPLHLSPCRSAGLERRIREICETRVRYGYRRVHVLLEREGWGTNIKRTYKIYRELGLQLRNKTPKRRVKAKLREDRQMAVGPNDIWAMDFVHDQLATGKKLRVLTVTDTFSRYVPVLDPRHSYRGGDVVQTLERVCRQVGYPKTIRVDQGTEFVSRDLDLWAYAKGVILDFSRPGKPTDNAFYRSIQRPLPSGLPEPALVPDPCGCPRKDGGLA